MFTLFPGQIVENIISLLNDHDITVKKKKNNAQTKHITQDLFLDFLFFSIVYMLTYTQMCMSIYAILFWWLVLKMTIYRPWNKKMFTPLALLFFLIILNIIGFLNFYIKFRVIFIISIRKPAWIFIDFALNQEINLGRVNFIITWVSQSEHAIYLNSFRHFSQPSGEDFHKQV